MSEDHRAVETDEELPRGRRAPIVRRARHPAALSTALRARPVYFGKEVTYALFRRPRRRDRDRARRDPGHEHAHAPIDRLERTATAVILTMKALGGGVSVGLGQSVA
jgi:glutamine synthetase